MYSERRRDRKNKENKRKKTQQNILAVFILLAIVLGGFVGYYGSKLSSFLDTIGESNEIVEPETTLESLENLEDNKPFAVLLLGTDIEENGVARSDTIIVVTVNPAEESMKMLSIPRDTRVTLTNGRIEKINATYATGGAASTMNMVEAMLDIPIKYYATIDFRGLVKLVDAVGGIEVNSDLEFTEENYVDYEYPIYIKKGFQTLNGAEALGYARMRKKDPRGDFGRQDRQKEVIVGVLNKLNSYKTVTIFTNILDSIEDYLKTNLSSREMLIIGANYFNVLKDIEQLSLEGFDDEEYFPHYGLDVYIWEPYQESLNKISQELKIHLELEEQTNQKQGFID